MFSYVIVLAISELSGPYDGIWREMLSLWPNDQTLPVWIVATLPAGDPTPIELSHNAQARCIKFSGTQENITSGYSGESTVHVILCVREPDLILTNQFTLKA